jgi:para-aminobenzoate synthetase component 1
LNLTPKQAVLRLEGRIPYIYLGGLGSNYQLLITDFEEVSFEDFEESSISQLLDVHSSSEKDLNLVGGFVGILSYDDYSNQNHKNNGLKKSRVFLVKSALVFGESVRVQGELSDKVRTCLTSNDSEYMISTEPEKNSIPGIELLPKSDDESYLDSVRNVISDIRKGRFYQLNLLRYFSLKEDPSSRQLIERFFLKSGSHASIYSLGDETIYSFSPEKFVSFYPENEDNLIIETCPIKGTRPRSLDPLEDVQLKDELAQSKKDNAELHMIVDLMRNDLNRLANPMTVEVIDPGSVQSFESVHHLVAKIKGRVKSKMILKDLFRCFLPAGSITGAPKIEVMSAIYNIEKRSRGWFMGNAFYLSRCGRFDSSVLIRTLHKNSNGTFEYAAGSGLVIKSVPEEELEEIHTKCRVLTTEISRK